MNINPYHFLAALIVILLSLGACSSDQETEEQRATSMYDVTIKVVLAEESKFFVIEEIPPADAEIIDKGLFSMDASGHLKYVEFQQANSKDLTYTIAAQPSAVFTGQYSIDGVTEDVTNILGAPTAGSGSEIDASSPGVYRIITASN